MTDVTVLFAGQVTHDIPKMIETRLKLIRMFPVNCDTEAKALLNQCWSHGFSYKQSKHMLKESGYLLTERFYNAYKALINASYEDDMFIKEINDEDES